MDITSLSKLNCFAETKVGKEENMSVSGSGQWEGSVYIFCPFLWFVSFGQAKEMNKILKKNKTTCSRGNVFPVPLSAKAPA